MACDFCRNTDYHSGNPCPVCGPVSHAGNTRIRKLPKALRNAIANASGGSGGSASVGGTAQNRGTGAPVPGANSRARYTPPPAAPKAPPTNPPPAPPFVAPKPAQPARMGILTPITPEDWRAAERFVRGVLWAKRLPATVDSVATVVTQRDEESTLPPISRGDFRGLWVAVEAGHLSESAAIELAASWAGRP